jgi:hypothetical protein
VSGICLQFSGIISSYTLLCISCVVRSNSFVDENKLKARLKNEQNLGIAVNFCVIGMLILKASQNFFCACFVIEACSSFVCP